MKFRSPLIALQLAMSFILLMTIMGCAAQSKIVIKAADDSIEELSIEKVKEEFLPKLKRLKKEGGNVGAIAALLLIKMNYNKGNKQYIKGTNEAKKENNDYFVRPDVFFAENIFEILANDIEKVTTNDFDIQEVVDNFKKSILFRIEGIQMHNQGYYVLEENYKGEFEKGTAKLKIADSFIVEAIKGLQQLMKRSKNNFSEFETELLSNDISYYSTKSAAPQSPITPRETLPDSTPSASETKKWQSTTVWRANPCMLDQHEVLITLRDNKTIQGFVIECSPNSMTVLSGSKNTRSIRLIHLRNIKALLWR